MNGNAPNSPSTGFHDLPHRKSNPNWAKDGRARYAIAAIIAANSRTINNAQQNRRLRKMASPASPVGESMRGQRKTPCATTVVRVPVEVSFMRRCPRSSA
jgi:hypothetical protein